MAKLALNTQVYADDDWTDNNGIPNGTATFTINGATKTPGKLRLPIAILLRLSDMSSKAIFQRISASATNHPKKKSL
jgi:hypothetical protein